jgi:hypothetical protein
MDTKKSRVLPKLRTAVVTTAIAAGLSLAPGLLRAQDQTQATGETKPFTSSVFDTTQSLANTLTHQLATKSVINLGNNDNIWVVGGEQNKINETTGLNTTSYDLGFKLNLGGGATGSWIRGTALNDTDVANKFSYGTDALFKAFKAEGVVVSLLGGVSSMDLSADITRHTNYDGGINLNFAGTQNFFGFVDSKGIATSTTETVNGKKKTQKSEREEMGFRAGYVGTNYKGRLVAFVVDGQETMKLVPSAFVGWDNVRFMGSWNPNVHYGWTQTYLTFGMRLTDRTLTSQIMDQFIYNGSCSLTQNVKSLSTPIAITTPGCLGNSDNTMYASTPPVYLATTGRPSGALGQFVRIKWLVNPNDTRHNDFDIYGITTFRNGMLVVEEATKDTLGTMHFGGGVGFKVWSSKWVPTPIFVAQTNNAMQGSLVYTFGK